MLQPLTLTLDLWRCFNEDDGRGPNRGEIFIFFVTPRPGLDPRPRTFRMASESHPRQAMTVSYHKLNEHAPTEMPVCWILLDIVGLELYTASAHTSQTYFVCV